MPIINTEKFTFLNKKSIIKISYTKDRTTGQKKEAKYMLTCIYVVEKIDGDYAELRRVDALTHDPEETKTIARALLPAEIMEGNKLLYENLQYRLIAE